MKGENEILVLLAEVLRNQDRDREAFEARFDRLEARVGGLEEQLNKVNWRHEDLAQKLEELRYTVSQTEKAVMATTHAVASLTQAVAVMLAQQTQNDTRIRRLERPDEFGPNATAS